MSRLTPEQYLLLNLEQQIPSDNDVHYLTREQAYQALKNMSGEDFGYDVKAWRKWLRAHHKQRLADLLRKNE